MAREIPEGSALVQTGLYLYSYTRTISGVERTFYQLFSAEGYCFYENYLPEEDRIYMQWTSILSEEEVANYTSVPVEDWMEIASVPPGGNHEIM